MIIMEIKKNLLYKRSCFINDSIKIMIPTVGEVIDDEEIDMYMVNPKAPCFIKDAEESYIYLILPVNFTVSK